MTGKECANVSIDYDGPNTLPIQDMSLVKYKGMIGHSARAMPYDHFWTKLARANLTWNNALEYKERKCQY